jgi:hypothetical protein
MARHILFDFVSEGPKLRVHLEAVAVYLAQMPPKVVTGVLHQLVEDGILNVTRCLSKRGNNDAYSADLLETCEIVALRNGFCG